MICCSCFFLGHSSGRNSLNKLQQSSTSWGNIRKTNVADFLSDSENEDVLNSSSQGSTSKHKSSRSRLNDKEKDVKKRGKSLCFTD